MTGMERCSFIATTEAVVSQMTILHLTEEDVIMRFLGVVVALLGFLQENFILKFGKEILGTHANTSSREFCKAIQETGLYKKTDKISIEIVENVSLWELPFEC